MKLASKCMAMVLILTMLAFVVGATQGGNDSQAQAGNNYAGYRPSDNRGSISPSTGALVNAGYNIVLGPASFESCRAKLKSFGARTSTGAPW